jgi:hypothetical protein
MAERIPHGSRRTLLADVSIAEEGGCGTSKPIVVEALYYGNSEFFARVVCGRRDLGKGIVKVNYVRTFFHQNGFQFSLGCARPHRVYPEFKLLEYACRLNRGVVTKPEFDAVAGLGEHPGFRPHYGVFSARLLIKIMDEENLHEKKLPRLGD